MNKETKKDIFSILSFHYNGKSETIGRCNTEEEAQEKIIELDTKHNKELGLGLSFFVVHHLATA